MISVPLNLRDPLVPRLESIEIWVRDLVLLGDVMDVGGSIETAIARPLRSEVLDTMARGQT